MFEVDVERLDQQIDAIIDELLTGPGAVVIRGAFSDQDVAEARELIMRFSAEIDKETHFQGANTDTLHLQRRVWNLLD